jgi:hypothetical protein
MFKHKRKPKNLDIDVSVLSTLLSVPELNQNCDQANSLQYNNHESHNHSETAKRQSVKFLSVEELKIKFPKLNLPKDTEGGWITESGDRIFLVVGGIHHLTTPVLTN